MPTPRVYTLANGEALTANTPNGRYFSANTGDFVTVFVSGTVDAAMIYEINAGPLPHVSGVTDTLGWRWCELTRGRINGNQPVCSGFNDTGFYSMRVLTDTDGTYTIKAMVIDSYNQVQEAGGGYQGAVSDSNTESTLIYYGQAKQAVKHMRMQTPHYNARFRYAIASDLWNDVLDAASSDLIELNGNLTKEGRIIVSGVYERMETRIDEVSDTTMKRFKELETARALAEEKVNIDTGKRVL